MLLPTVHPTRFHIWRTHKETYDSWQTCDQGASPITDKIMYQKFIEYRPSIGITAGRNWRQDAASTDTQRGKILILWNSYAYLMRDSERFWESGISEFYAGSGLQDLDTCAATSSRHLSSHQVMLGSRIPKDPWSWHQLVLKNGGYPVPQFMNFKPWDVACDVWRHVEAPSGEEWSALFGA